MKELPIISLHHASHSVLNKLKVEDIAVEITQNALLRKELEDFAHSGAEWSTKGLRAYFTKNPSGDRVAKRRKAYLYLRAMSSLGLFTGESHWPTPSRKTFNNRVLKHAYRRRH